MLRPVKRGQSLRWADVAVAVDETTRPAPLAKFEISPSGLDLDFQDLDADLYLPALPRGPIGGSVGGRAKPVRCKLPERPNPA